ncbi:MAG: peroxiredoxin [Pseudomonadota bacterium]
MAIAMGEKLPTADLLEVGPDGPTSVPLAEALGSGKAVLLGMPGAFTGTCSNQHIPSFLRTREAMKEKGVEAVICVTVNDPFVNQAWDASTGAGEGGVRLLADPSGAFIKAIGLDFDAPPVGFYGRSKRFSMLVENGEVKSLSVEDNPGSVEVTSGEAMLATL